MPGKRAPLPPITRAVTPLQWAIVLACWFLLTLSAAEPMQKQLAASGTVLTLREMRIVLAVDWALWGLLLPGIFATLDRLPLRRRVWPKHLAGWVAAALAFGVVHALLSLPLFHLAARILEVPSSVFALPELQLRRLAVDDAKNFNVGVVAYLVLQLLHRSRGERARVQEVERSLREARLHALALELQPHFLFNTLNGIAALVRADPKAAERMLVRLSDLLRLTLESGKAGQVSLGEEVHQLQLYLELQQMRHGSRLTVQTDIPPALEPAKVPAMLLQPLVENALSHGIGGRPGAGTLRLRAWREGPQLWLSVEDDGVGIPKGGPAREGIGLGNTRARLGALYPEEHEFHIELRPEGGTRVRIRVPYEENGSGGRRGS